MGPRNLPSTQFSKIRIIYILVTNEDLILNFVAVTAVDSGNKALELLGLVDESNNDEDSDSNINLHYDHHVWFYSLSLQVFMLI